MTDSLRAGRSIRSSTMLISIALMLLHGVLVMRHFPMSIFVEETALTSGDLSWHFASATEGEGFATGEFPRIWGYSPSFMAGYPWGVWNSFSKRGYEFAPMLFRGLGVERAFYLWLVLTALATPLLVVPAARAFKLSWRETGTALCLAIGLFQFGNAVSYFWTFGNVAFPFVSALALLFTGWFYRASLGEGWRYAFLAGALAGLVFWLHPL